ncbi:MAG: hypothetical protein AMXMBFR4_21890 [Candidatus Hydrogenedentota bacterium]
MYIGRIVCIALSKDGKLCAAYRVSSRSFPNRRAVMRENAVAIVPRPGHEGDVQKNPYIAYNCARIVCEGGVAVVSNGSHTDPIAEKLQSGMPIRDALALSLLALDYEHDQYHTPRIAAVADRRDQSGWLATVREDGMNVRRMPLAPGKHFYIATYEESDVTTAQSGEFPVANSGEACAFMLGGGVFAQRTNPVTAVAAMEDGNSFELAAHDAPQP